VESLILRLASKFPGRRDQLLFLINNYDVVMSIIIERTKDDSKESETFREQLKSRSDEFAEQMLEQHFGALIGWLKDAERKLDAGDIEGLRQEEKRVSNIIQTFSADWKKSLDQINGLAIALLTVVLFKLSSGEIMTSFPNLKLGTGILQQSLTLLVQYYHRFSRVLGVAPLSQIPAAAQLINIHQLMVEVKKYKPSF